MKFKYLLVLLILISSITWADDFVPEDEENASSTANTFTLDGNDTGGDVALQFGATLGEYIKWNEVKGLFELSDDLDLLDGELSNFRVENLTNAPTCDGTVNGKIYHNTTDTFSYVCDGASWKRIDGGGSGSITQLSSSITNGDELLFTSTSDPNFERIVDVYYEDSASVNDTSTWDILTTDEAQYVQENNNLTEFASDSITLEASGPPTPGVTNLALGATAIGSDATRPFANGNDDNTGTFWYNQGGGPSAGHWWGVDLGAPTTVMRAQINWYSTTYHATTMRIEGSADGTNWNTVATVNPAGGNTTDETWDFTPTTYRYWRYFCVTGNNATYFVLREGRFFEAVSSGYSTTPAYVTSDNGKEIDTSIWSSLNSMVPTVSEPANTSLRWLFTFDGGTTWRGFSGGWNTQTLTNIENVGMTTAQVLALSSTDWGAANGLNSGDGTLNFATSLTTTDTAETPKVYSLGMDYDTAVYWEKGDDTTVRVRLYDDVTTGVQNLTGGTKNFKVNILHP